MTEQIDEKEIKKAEDYLRAYRYNGKLLRLDRYQKEYFKSEDGSVEIESLGEVPLARARMYGIRHLVNTLPNCDEKLFIYYHYIKGETVERSGELIGKSRSAAYRMKKRGQIMVAKALRESEAD